MGRKKLTLKYIKSEIEKYNYKCLSDIYVNNHTKLKVQCNNGHIYGVVWNSFQLGHRCPYCAGVKKKTMEEIKEYIESFGYKCLSEKYINCKSKLKIQCNIGHTYEVTWANFQTGWRCPYCAGVKKKTMEEIKKYVELFGYKCLSKEYINSKNKLEIQCDKDHIYKVIWNSFSRGHRCPICWFESESGENHHWWTNYTEEDRKNFISYRREITQLTNTNYKKYKYIINPNNLKRGRNKFHLDHIYSVIDGFNNNVDPNIIASPVNLRMLTENENIAKNGTSHMTLEQLYDLHKQFLKEV